MIEKINDEPLGSNYDELLRELVGRALNLKDLGLGNKQVAIIAPKTTLEIDECLTLLGMSVFVDNKSEFVYEDKIIESKFFVFQSAKEGEHEVIFRANYFQNV